MDTAFVRLRAVQVSIAAACALTGRSRATTHYRHQVERPGPVHGPHRARRPPPSTITPDERAQVLAVLNSEPYRDLAIPQVWARELDEGRRYWCSMSSMYRIARAAGQSRDDAPRLPIRHGSDRN